MKFIKVFSIIAFILCFAAAAQSQELSTKIESQTHEISGDVMSPFCPGRSLNDCPSSSATDLRNQISQMLTEGKTREEVLGELYKKYGDEIRAMPKKQGFGLVGWLSPLAFVLLGLSILTFWIKKHRPETDQPVIKSELSADMLKRIEEEVRGKN